VLPRCELKRGAGRVRVSENDPKGIWEAVKKMQDEDIHGTIDAKNDHSGTTKGLAMQTTAELQSCINEKTGRKEV